MAVALVEFQSWERSVGEVLDACGAPSLLAEQSHILIKPNLINASPAPITTPVSCVAAIIDYIRLHSGADIVVAEGCGDSHSETAQVFQALGYEDLARDKDVDLLDLNTAPLELRTDEGCEVFTEMWLPEVAFSHFIFSVPVLKVHSLAQITGTLKNMMGFPPPAHYSGSYGSWKKALFHGQMHASIRDLNRYVTPDLTLMDATVGMAEYHLGGPHCDPPVNKLLAGTDSVAVDREAAGLLGLDWRDIPHLV